MKIILWEDRANPGTLKRDTTRAFTENRMPKHERLDTQLKQLKGLGNCRIYLAKVRGNKLVHARKIAERKF